jgi:thiamine biosynthesis lipoprotein
MGTHWAVRYWPSRASDPQALERDLAAAVSQVDVQMSPWNPGSDLMRLNRAPVGQWMTVAPALAEVLDLAVEVGRQSGGAYDAAVGALVNAWGFGAAGTEPDADAIQAAVAAHCPAHRGLDVDPQAGVVRKRAAMTLDLCGIAKGYAVDRMADVLRAHGVEHALVSLDGELRACGSRADGKPWAVALESPRDGVRTTHGVVELEDLAIATSGDYRRWIRIGSTRVSHTMDGRRAAPVCNAVASVTVLARDCVAADAWATALLVAGPEEGLALTRRMGLDALFLLRREGRLVEIGLGRFAVGS